MGSSGWLHKGRSDASHLARRHVARGSRRGLRSGQTCSGGAHPCAHPVRQHRPNQTERCGFPRQVRFLPGAFASKNRRPLAGSTFRGCGVLLLLVCRVATGRGRPRPQVDDSDSGDAQLREVDAPAPSSRGLRQGGSSTVGRDASRSHDARRRAPPLNRTRQRLVSLDQGRCRQMTRPGQSGRVGFASHRRLPTVSAWRPRADAWSDSRL